MDGLSISCFVLGIAVISFHCTGATFLLKTNHNFTDNVELFSLSLSSIILSILFTIRTTYGIYHPKYLKIQPDFKELPKYASIHSSFQNSCMVPLFTAVISLTLQRFFAVKLHLRYEASWIFLNRARIIISSWVLGIIIFIVALIINYAIGIDYQVWNIAFSSLLLLGLVATNVIFFTVYSYIYIKFKQTREQTVYRNQNKGKLFTPIILCGSLFVFGTLPYFFHTLITDVRYTYIAAYLDGITSSIVYIFLSEKVMNRIQRWNNNVGSDNVA